MKVEPRLAEGALEGSGDCGMWVDEVLDGVRYGMAAVLVEERPQPFQRVTIIDSQAYGKALLLDGCWMTAERQGAITTNPWCTPPCVGPRGSQGCW